MGIEENNKIDMDNSGDEPNHGGVADDGDKDGEQENEVRTELEDIDDHDRDIDSCEEEEDSEAEEDEDDEDDDFERRKEIEIEKASVLHAKEMYEDILKSRGRKWADKMKSELKVIARSKIEEGLKKRLAERGIGSNFRPRK
jgi:hypothetical protein